VKWGFIRRDDGKPHYITCNGDESEPGTFKDRYILHNDPHQLIEGMLIAAYALNVNLAYVYIRCEFPKAAGIVTQALKEAREKGYLGKNIFGSGLTSTSTSIRAPVPTSAARRPASSSRSRESVPDPASSLPTSRPSSVSTCHPRL